MEDMIDEHEQQREEPGGSTLERMRDELIQQQLVLRDDDLRERVEDWIQESLQYADADTAADYIESRLNELLTENDMYRSPEAVSADDAFPDDCQGCPHVGSSCPMLLDRTRVQERERKLDGSMTEREARQVFSDQARETGCVVVPKALSEWDAKHSDLIREGHELLTEIGESIHSTGGE